MNTIDLTFRYKYYAWVVSVIYLLGLFYTRSGWLAFMSETTPLPQAINYKVGRWSIHSHIPSFENYSRSQVTIWFVIEDPVAYVW